MTSEPVVTTPVQETNFADLKLLKRGKVRDMYDLGDSLLMVATDRISAFDVIMDDPIPGKGIILTQISLFWFEAMQSLVPNHVISSDVAAYPAVCQPYADALRGRSMQVRKAEPLPIECVVRGYISGSGWKSYQQDQSVCGITLPAGLQESDKLPEPLFTPSTKADLGLHDINIDFEEAADLVRHHHERLDGKGYPDGLKGEEISTGARIVAVADSFDAMTSNRPYRAKHSYIDAIESLRRQGEKFDLDVVESLVRLIEKGAIRE